MSSTQTTKRIPLMRASALMSLGLLVAATISWNGLNNNSQPLLEGDTNANQLLSSSLRRRLSRSVMDEETQQKQMRSFLGGLSPLVDEARVPVYLKDTTDTSPNVYVMDMYQSSGGPKTTNRDPIFFWHIPKASGNIMKNIMDFCFDLSRAEQLEEQPSMEFVKNNILNMDTSSPEGLSHSYEHQLANSQKVDVIVTNYFLSGSVLFTEEHGGRAFTLMRHPVDLALSLFYHRRKANIHWLKLSFDDYVNSDAYMDSWMVRQLTGTMPWVDLDESHVIQAKLVVKQKIFVGITSEMGETLRQLKAHFRWEEKEPMCVHNFLTEREESNHPGLQGGRGGKVWNVLVEKEKWDMELYYYALELFAEQRKRYPPTPEE